MYAFKSRFGASRQGRGLRRGVLLALAGLVLAVALSACAGSSESTGSQSASGTEVAKGEVAVAKVGVPSQFIEMSQVCKGNKPLTVGFAWGFSGNAWRQIAKKEVEEEAAKCPLIKKVIFTEANLEPQKEIANINSLVARGVNVLLVYPDSGPTLIPAMRAATQAGVTVIPWATGNFPGTPGRDYFDLETELPEYNGRVWAEWMTKALHGKGNVIFLGGTAGNPTSKAEFEGAKEVFEENPGMKFLIDEPVATEWEPAKEQQVMAGLLTKFPEIDGVITDYGGSATGAIRAFQQAGRPLVPMTANDYNDFACEWEKLHKTEPGFQIATVSSRTWIVRPALRRAVAAQEGTEDNEPSRLELPLIEDSIAGGKLAPKCDKSLPPDAILSSDLSKQQLTELFGG